MIFVAVGTQKFPMNRLLEAVDDCAENGIVEESFFAQVGNSTYLPNYYQYSTFLTKKEFEDKIRECNILITHSGVATIILGLKYHKPVIVVPRLSKYGEHVDDHQLQIANSFEKLNFVIKCEDVSQLNRCISDAREHKFNEYVSQRKNVIKAIKSFIDCGE